jgi:ATP-binding cassette subfamily B protein
LKRVFSYAAPYLRYFVLTIVFAALGVSLSLAVPVFIGEAVDCCIGKGNVDFHKLGRIIVLLASMVVASTFFSGS